jgi:CrcB protein
LLPTILVAAGGAIGSVCRYWAALAALPLSRETPWGTIAINIVGSFAIGLFGSLTVAHGRFPVHDNGRLFFMVGICGGFTTFSSFSLQTLDLLRAGAAGRAFINVALSVGFCLGAVALGYMVGSHFSEAPSQLTQNAIEEEAS